MTKKIPLSLSENKTAVQVPFLGESVNGATLNRWFQKSGERAEDDTLLAELETEKIALEIRTPTAGVLGPFLKKEGDFVQPDDVLVYVYAQEKGLQPKVSETKQPENQETSQAPELSPVKKPSNLTRSQKSQADTLSHGPAPARHKPEPLALKPESRQEERYPLSPLRLAAAEQLKKAQNTAAIATTFNEIDMGAVMAVRAQHNSSSENAGQKLGISAFFVAACTKALTQFPVLNAEIQGTEVVFKNYYNIGIAMNTDAGLVVPVIKNAQDKTLLGMEKAIQDFAAKAKNRTLVPGDLSGSTFTISNGGIYGSLLSTPILNSPESGILGLHRIQKRAVVLSSNTGDSVAIRSMMYVALSYDHRLIDGKDAVSFLTLIKTMIEDPSEYLL